MTKQINTLAKYHYFLGFFAAEIEREKLPVPADYNVPAAPNPKDLIDLEVFTIYQIAFKTFVRY